jgi:hypothetical protein
MQSIGISAVYALVKAWLVVTAKQMSRKQPNLQILTSLLSVAILASLVVPVI